MSTIKRLSEAVSAIWNNEDATDTMHQRVPVLLMELEAKQNTPITAQLLLKNGFTWSGTFRSYYISQGGKRLMLSTNKGGFSIYATTINLKSVADLEDALSISGIDKEIQL